MSRGNYRELLESFAKFDSVFERRLHGRLAESERGGVGGGGFTGVSPEIQNDLINCLDSIIEDEIFKEGDKSLLRMCPAFVYRGLHRK